MAGEKRVQKERKGKTSSVADIRQMAVGEMAHAVGAGNVDAAVVLLAGLMHKPIAGGAEKIATRVTAKCGWRYFAVLAEFGVAGLGHGACHATDGHPYVGASNANAVHRAVAGTAEVIFTFAAVQLSGSGVTASTHGWHVQAGQRTTFVALVRRRAMGGRVASDTEDSLAVGALLHSRRATHSALGLATGSLHTGAHHVLDFPRGHAVHILS